MKNSGIIGSSCFIFISLILLFLYAPLAGDAPQTQCFKCHTSAKKLIEITREIAKSRPVVKSENEGEG